MEFLIYYALFAVTTALAALYELFIPSIKTVCREAPESMVAQNPLLAGFSLTLFAVCAAPVILFPCLIPSYGVRFRDALVTGLKVSS